MGAADAARFSASDGAWRARTAMSSCLGFLKSAEVAQLQRRLAAEEQARRLAEQQLAEKELQVGSLTQRAVGLEARLDSQEEDSKELENGLLESIERSGSAEEHAGALSALRARLGALHRQLQEERFSVAQLQEALGRCERELKERPRPPEQAGFRQVDLGSIIAKEREICELQQMLTEELSRRNELEHRLDLYEYQQGALVTPVLTDASMPFHYVDANGHQAPVRAVTPVRCAAEISSARTPLRPLTPSRSAVSLRPPTPTLVTPSLSMRAGDEPPAGQCSPRQPPQFRPAPAAGVRAPPTGTTPPLVTVAPFLRFPSSSRPPPQEEKAVDAVRATSIASPQLGGVDYRIPASPDKPPAKSEADGESSISSAPWTFRAE